ncbi:VOC family protein [Paenibacillus sp. GYB003]|uniref:VOC family protein n=1 Tax=Paenibacillus sp. GYB003 TaxID=2994392 RepID=UPI002F966642
MAKPKTIGASLTVLLVSDASRSQAYYRDVLGFDVTDWWAERDGLNGLALKLLQAASPEDVKPNAPAKGQSVGADMYAYVDTWDRLEALFREFKAKGAFIAQDIVTYPEGGPWKEFVVRDPDGYAIAFGGVDGRPGGRRSPIRPHIGTVTLSVRDLDRAAGRYAALLDMNVNPADRVHDGLHVFRMQNGTDLALEASDTNEGPARGRHSARITIYTDRLEAAFDFAGSAGFDVVADIDRSGEAPFFQIRDEDGNRIAVVQSLD